MKEGNTKIHCINISDPIYPKLLHQIPDPPQQLYCSGNLTLLNKPSLAVVGSRKFSKTGNQSCVTLVSDLTKAGLVIVSGLALGIDSIAHETTLNNGGETIAVLGTGLNEKVIYPKQNINLMNNIIKSGGLIISEYGPDKTATRYTFPQRNRIIASISLGTLVIEADIKSGSLITANCAAEYNRDVFAVPYSIEQKQGTNELIKKGAYIVNKANDVLEII